MAVTTAARFSAPTVVVDPSSHAPAPTIWVAKSRAPSSTTRNSLDAAVPLGLSSF